MQKREIITNQSDSVLTVYLEPWGSDYSLGPGQSMDFVVEVDDEMAEFEVVQTGDGSLQVYAPERDEPDVLFRGLPVECGARLMPED